MKTSSVVVDDLDFVSMIHVLADSGASTLRPCIAEA
jgi:hypothetical protein